MKEREVRQVFLNAPWVHDAEPPQLKAIFEQHGVLRKFPKGFIFNHGGTQGNVYYITKGLVFFTFPDPKDKFRVFGILPPDRVVGDLDAVTQFSINVFATSARPTECLVVPGRVYREALEADPELMKLYAINAVAKEETHMEGMMAVFTLPAEKRLIALASSVINSYYPLKPDGWNPMPRRSKSRTSRPQTARQSAQSSISGWIKASRSGTGAGSNFTGSFSGMSTTGSTSIPGVAGPRNPEFLDPYT